jgi:hypothetical protein
MRKQLVSWAAVASVAAAFVATHISELRHGPDALASPLEAAPARAAMSRAALARLLPVDDRTGRHLGFDTYAYPGDDVMRAWRDAAPYEWVGYYLPAPCHNGRSWVGTRERLADMGWGMAVIYVGQQTWDKTPRGYETEYRAVRRTKYISKRVKTTRVVHGKRVTRYVTTRIPVKRMVRVPVHVRVDPKQRPIDDCNAQLVNATRGKIEAADAIRRASTEGFPRGTIIFLDIEYMRATPAKMREYYKAWTRAVLADGRFRPGFYAHTRNAAHIYKDVKAEYVRAGLAQEPPFWITGESEDFSTDKAPHEVGHSFAAVWQGMIDVVEEWSGHSLPIDVNVAQLPDPSRQYVVE